MKGNYVKQISNNYARHIATGEYVFFADANAPAFTHPQSWAFFRVPRGVVAATFRGRLVGVNPAEGESDSEAPEN